MTGGHVSGSDRIYEALSARSRTPHQDRGQCARRSADAGSADIRAALKPLSVPPSISRRSLPLTDPAERSNRT
jgi:hypothetical protein